MECLGCVKLENDDACVTLADGRIVCVTCDDFLTKERNDERKNRAVIISNSAISE